MVTWFDHMTTLHGHMIWSHDYPTWSHDLITWLTWSHDLITWLPYMVTWPDHMTRLAGHMIWSHDYPTWSHDLITWSDHMTRLGHLYTRHIWLQHVYASMILYMLPQPSTYQKLLWRALGSGGQAVWPCNPVLIKAGRGRDDWVYLVGASRCHWSIFFQVMR